MKRKHLFLVAFTAILGNLFFYPLSASAHCDGMDGPVVLAAKEALKTGNVNHVLIWVREKDEGAIRRVFEHTLRVRQLGDDARKLADTFFFETLVRLHRAGEGAPFTGLKPAGRDPGPAIPAADHAIETGTVNQVLDLLNKSVKADLQLRFEKVQKLKNYDINDVQAGRDFVKAYVGFLHFVESIYHTSTEGNSTIDKLNESIHKH